MHTHTYTHAHTHTHTHTHTHQTNKTTTKTTWVYWYKKFIKWLFRAVAMCHILWATVMPFLSARYHLCMKWKMKFMKYCIRSRVAHKYPQRFYASVKEFIWLTSTSDSRSWKHNIFNCFLTLEWAGSLHSSPLSSSVVPGSWLFCSLRLVILHPLYCVRLINKCVYLPISITPNRF